MTKWAGEIPTVSTEFDSTYPLVEENVPLHCSRREVTYRES